MVGCYTAVTMGCESLSNSGVIRAIDRELLSSCENAVLWRGHFNASGQEKSVNLSINGGTGEY